METIVEQKELFAAVQMSGIFEDSKTFPDMIGKKNIVQIAQEFKKQKVKTDFSLKKFVLDNFEYVENGAQDFEVFKEKDPQQHITELWDFLTKKTKSTDANSTYIPLPNSFIVPGGRFQEVYYWDSYFTMLGLIISKKYSLVENIIDNFAYLIDTFGFIPNGNRTYFLSRSQPPFFCLMVDLLNTFEFTKKPEFYLPQLVKEYDFWMKNRAVKMPDGEMLNIYNDSSPTPRPESYIEDIELAEHSTQSEKSLYRNLRAACESGWDFSSRWFSEENNLGSINTTKIIPVDLNCLLFHLERRIAELHPTLSKVFLANAQRRQKAIQKYFWNEKEAFFTDYDLEKNIQRSNLTLAGMFPLFFGIANSDQANLCANQIKKNFLKPGGLITTTLESGQQWDAPNGWAPLQWISYKGLQNYGFENLANTIKENWLNLNEAVFKTDGKFTEKYNVTNTSGETGGGEYPNQDGFGWTNGVFLAFKNEN
ncbi:alpha,alpha-trehalase TreF [Lacihabitans sp. LS3-19]|uniref:alpha,alpha-trehalase TreF n=1 Tax=Lacihabitans sp. LS3-19 TaxID=2487335 RepID=UPI0020CD10FD|nr:alpha,alpha-trehalase TreF [Lacihabitans sp. LS3-19]MCP9768258.1 alpha,alpha-trehalase TreF [Lacihabitans sp. LS3-19]